MENETRTPESPETEESEQEAHIRKVREKLRSDQIQWQEEVENRQKKREEAVQQGSAKPCVEKLKSGSLKIYSQGMHYQSQVVPEQTLKRVTLEDGTKFKRIIFIDELWEPFRNKFNQPGLYFYGTEQDGALLITGAYDPKLDRHYLPQDYGVMSRFLTSIPFMIIWCAGIVMTLGLAASYISLKAWRQNSRLNKHLIEQNVDTCYLY